MFTSRMQRSVVQFIVNGTCWQDGFSPLHNLQAFVLDQRQRLELRSYCFGVVEGRLVCNDQQTYCRRCHTSRSAGDTLAVHIPTGRHLKLVDYQWKLDGQPVPQNQIQRVLYSRDEVDEQLRRRRDGLEVTVEYDIDAAARKIHQGRVICREYALAADFSERSTSLLRDGSAAVATAIQLPVLWVQFPGEQEIPEHWFRRQVVACLSGDQLTGRVLVSRPALNVPHPPIRTYEQAVELFGEDSIKELCTALAQEFSHVDPFGLMLPLETIGSIPRDAYVLIDSTAMPQMQLVSRHCLQGSYGLLDWDLDTSYFRTNASPRRLESKPAEIEALVGAVAA